MPPCLRATADDCRASLETRATVMGRLSRYVVTLAALAVLVVLITPALDELPCTAVHKAPAVAAFASTPLPLAPLFSTATQSIAGSDQVVVVDDVLSLTCIFLC